MQRKKVSHGQIDPVSIQRVKQIKVPGSDRSDLVLAACSASSAHYFFFQCQIGLGRVWYHYILILRIFYEWDHIVS